MADLRAIVRMQHQVHRTGLNYPRTDSSSQTDWLTGPKNGGSTKVTFFFKKKKN
jgi:hypothetical protein